MVISPREGRARAGQIVYCELLRNADLLSGWNCPSGGVVGKVLLAPFQLSWPKDKFKFAMSAERILSQDLAEKNWNALAGEAAVVEISH